MKLNRSDNRNLFQTANKKIKNIWNAWSHVRPVTLFKFMANNCRRLFFSGGSRYTQDISSIICTSKAYGSDKEQQQQKQKITYDSMVYFSPI